MTLAPPRPDKDRGGLRLAPFPMQKVKMLETIRSKQGWLREGRVYEVEDRIVRDLINDGLVELVIEDKAIHDSPEKAVIRRRRKK